MSLLTVVVNGELVQLKNKFLQKTLQKKTLVFFDTILKCMLLMDDTQTFRRFSKGRGWKDLTKVNFVESPNQEVSQPWTTAACFCSEKKMESCGFYIYIYI